MGLSEEMVSKLRFDKRLSSTISNTSLVKVSKIETSTMTDLLFTSHRLNMVKSGNKLREGLYGE